LWQPINSSHPYRGGQGLRGLGVGQGKGKDSQGLKGDGETGVAKKRTPPTSQTETGKVCKGYTTQVQDARVKAQGNRDIGHRKVLTK